MTDRHMHEPHREPVKSTSKTDLCLAETGSKHHKPFNTSIWGVILNE
jgi:hypothetical protein